MQLGITELGHGNRLIRQSSSSATVTYFRELLDTLSKTVVIRGLPADYFVQPVQLLILDDDMAGLSVEQCLTEIDSLYQKIQLQIQRECLDIGTDEITIYKPFLVLCCNFISSQRKQFLEEEFEIDEFILKPLTSAHLESVLRTLVIAPKIFPTA